MDSIATKIRELFRILVSKLIMLFSLEQIQKRVFHKIYERLLIVELNQQSMLQSLELNQQSMLQSLELNQQSMLQSLEKFNNLAPATCAPNWERGHRAREVMKLLEPKVGLDHKYLGNKYDGGYLVPELLYSNVDGIVNIGIGSEYELDKSVLQDQKILLAMDPYLEEHPLQKFGYPKLNFVKLGLSSRFDSQNTNLEHVKKILSRLGIKNPAIFIDIEGSEHQHFSNNEEVEELNSYHFLIIEFHFLHNFISGVDPTRFNSFVALLEKINKSFLISFIHGNNCADKVVIDNREFADVIEVTYVNKKHVEKLGKKINQYQESIDWNFSNSGPNKEPIDLVGWYI